MSSSPDRGVSDGSVDLKLHPADRRAVFTAGISALFSTVMIAITAYFLYSSLDRRLALTTVEVFHEWGALRGVYERTVSYNPQFNPPTIHPRDSVRFDTGVHSLVVIKDLYERGLISYDVLNSTSARFNQSTGVLLSSPGVGGLDPRLIPQILLDFLTTKGQQTPGLPNSAMSTLVSAGLFNSSVDQTRVSRMLAELFTQANYTIPESYRNGWFMPEDPRILQRLLSAAGCTSPDALPGTTPITRSAGCQCIADTYLVFVRETVNMTSNVTWKARDAAAGDVLKCLDRRVVWHSWGAGRDRSVHPLGLALYGHCVCFLLCAAFLLSFYHFQIFPARWTAFERNLGIKIILAGFTSVFFIVFASHDFTANLFQLIGLILVLTNLIFSAHSILDYAGKGAGFRGGEEDQAKRVDPHPLTVCFWINVPVLLPAILGIVAISGFIRDFYAVLVVALIGALLGLVLQRMFWALWYQDPKFMKWVVPPLIAGFVDIFVVLSIILAVYQSNLSVYRTSHVSLIVLTLLAVLGLFLLLWYDFHVFRLKRLGIANAGELDQYFGDGGQQFLFVIVWLLLGGCSLLCMMDSREGS